MEDKEIKFGTELSEKLHERMKTEALKRKISMKLATSQAFELWLGIQATREPSPHHQKLTEILASGDMPTIDAVTQNIDVFHDRLRPARRPKIANSGR